MAENDMYFISRRNAENVRKKPLIGVAFPRTFSTLDARALRWENPLEGHLAI
ncbi:unnamed protein product, partial [Nesidiocoris tenuis]